MLHTLPITYLINRGKFQIKPERFTWIGTVASPTELLAAWYTAGVRSIEDAKRTAISIGATTPGDDLDMFPRIANSLLGTKFNIVDGYDGGPSISLAMDRGEVQGIRLEFLGLVQAPTQRMDREQENCSVVSGYILARCRVAERPDAYGISRKRRATADNHDFDDRR